MTQSNIGCTKINKVYLGRNYNVSSCKMSVFNEVGNFTLFALCLRKYMSFFSWSHSSLRPRLTTSPYSRGSWQFSCLRFSVCWGSTSHHTWIWYQSAMLTRPPGVWSSPERMDQLCVHGDAQQKTVKVVLVLKAHDSDDSPEFSSTSDSTGLECSTRALHFEWTFFTL